MNKTILRPDIFTTTRHALVDIETLDDSNRHTPAVFEAGLVLFNPHGENEQERIIQSTEPRCNPLLAVSEGFSFSAETIAWHMARRSLDLATNNTLPEMVANIFHILNTWEYDFIWSRGPDFDFEILKDLFRHYGHGDAPWRYWQQRDLRTIADFYPGEPPEKPHRALRDVLIDAEMLGHVIRENAPPFRIIGTQPDNETMALSNEPIDLHHIASAQLSS